MRQDLCAQGDIMHHARPSSYAPLQKSVGGSSHAVETLVDEQEVARPRLVVAVATILHPQ